VITGVGFCSPLMWYRGIIETIRASKKCADFMADMLQMFLKLFLTIFLYVTGAFLPYHLHKCTMLQQVYRLLVSIVSMLALLN